GAGRSCCPPEKAEKKSKPGPVGFNFEAGAFAEKPPAGVLPIQMPYSVGKKRRIRADAVRRPAGERVENRVAGAVGLELEDDTRRRRSVAPGRSIEKSGAVEDQRRKWRLPIRDAAETVKHHVPASIRFDLENGSQVVVRAAARRRSVEITGRIDDESRIRFPAVRRSAGEAVKQDEAAAVGLHPENGSEVVQSSLCRR